MDALDEKLFPGFKTFKVTVEEGIEITGVSGGSGPPLLLIHGFPQTHIIWHKIALNLSKSYSLVIPDIRGYGASSKPGPSDSHASYAKSAMARDMQTLMASFKHIKYFVCAHDRGARVAHKLCVDYPDHVIKAIFLDICPTLAMYKQTTVGFAKAYFHWFFLIQPYPLPEKSITPNAHLWVEKFMGAKHAGLSSFVPEASDRYREVLGDDQTVMGMCEDYRASASIDLKEAEDDLNAHRRVKCPLLILWGSHGVIEAMFDAVKEWKAVSDSTVEGKRIDCGHYIPEEKPEELTEYIQKFLTDAQDVMD